MSLDDTQQRLLEHFFCQASKPTVQQREMIANQLGTTGKVVQAWFSERRVKAKADKKIEEQQTLMALENAHHVSLDEDATAVSHSRPINYKTQSEASYASLARAISAARACLPRDEAEYDSCSVPASPAFPGASFPHYPAMESSFDLSASSMSRTQSQYSTFASTPLASTPIAEYPETAEFPFYTNQPLYMPSAPVANNFMDHQDCETTPKPRPVALSRPILQRTYTAPESGFGRPIPRRSISCQSGESVSSSENHLRPKRRNPKISQLGVNMARSRSSLGYEQSEYPYSVRRSNIPDIHQDVPITPVRRIPPIGSLHSGESPFSSAALTSGESFTSSQESPLVESFTGIHFPPSPITPEHQHGFQSQFKSVQAFQHEYSMNETFTPPATPLTPLGANEQNCLSAINYEEKWASDMKPSGLDMNNDLMLTDIFKGEDLSL